ncbi:MAG: AI-2E family transporter [Planctomycetaceae bacterium]|nr:AI-2E family transporter [Planctomycetaceae bacterium]
MISAKISGDPILRVLAVIAVLGVSQTFLVPIAVSGLITLTLSPVADWIRARGLKRWVGNLLSILLFLGLVGTTGWVVADQLGAMARTAPQLGGRILERTRSLGPLGTLLRGAFAGFQRTVQAGTAQISETKADVEAARVKDESARTDDSESRLLRTLQSIFLAVVGTLGNSIIILVLVGFLLTYREDLARRMLRFVEERGISISSSTLSEMAEKVSRYLLAEVTVNAFYGGVIALFTGLMGLPHPVFWGILAFLFRFIPYVGTWIVALMAFVFSLGITPFWVRPLSILAFWLLLEIVTADLIEPFFYGRRTGLTSLGVLLSALFWGWLWGAVGLILATPLTAALVVLGRDIPSLRWLHLLAASEPVDKAGPALVTTGTASAP